jgi:hypothetical protein
MTEKEEHHLKALRLYEAVMRGVSRILHDCKQLPIGVLRLADEPTYEEVGQILGIIAGMLRGIAEAAAAAETIQLAEKASEYVGHVQEIVAAIVNDDEALLDDLVAQLDKRSFL